MIKARGAASMHDAIACILQKPFDTLCVGLMLLLTMHEYALVVSYQEFMCEVLCELTQLCSTFTICVHPAPPDVFFEHCNIRM